MGFFSKIFGGMKKTKQAFDEKSKGLFSKKPVDEEFFEELEYILLSSDVGTKATEKVLSQLKVSVKKKKLKTAEACKNELKEILVEILEENQSQDFSFPLVLMVVGVNGVGKTTTIGKLAKNFEKEQKKVIIAAADTFRAAASDQLSVWANRAGVSIVKSSEGSDPGAVVFDAIASAKAKKADVLIVDTAGRLHNKVGLMGELKKISKIIEREMPGAEYHKVIVLDATTGQNAIEQVKLFDEAVNLTDIIITKLDGTAKGGVLFALAADFAIPIQNVGVGEALDDLVPFDAKEFVNSILG